MEIQYHILFMYLFLNEFELNSLPSVKWFQVVLFNRNDFILYQFMFAYSWFVSSITI